ncbi:hypothetical protein GOB33_27685 [Sinorhizobium meliloti]|nr:hypothetical protein [Sinorhizobium meliloti]
MRHQSRGAITLARTLLEDVCKWALPEAGESWEEAANPGPKRVKPAPRHAQHAVNFSEPMAMLLKSTWKARKGVWPRRA